MPSNRLEGGNSQIAANYHQTMHKETPELAKNITDQKAQQLRSAKNVSGWRVAGYHVLNLITLGTSGAAGSLCANSQAMGTQKMNSTKHFGQSHMAATHINKNDHWAMKGLKYASKIWSSLGHALLSPARGLQNRYGPQGKMIRAQMQHDFGTDKFGPKSAVSIAKDYKNQLSKEVHPNGNDGGAIDSMTLLRTGSPELKSQFYEFACSEYSEENTCFMDWTISKGLKKPDSTRLRGVDNPQQTTPDYPVLSKKEALDVFDNMVRAGSDLEINIASKERNECTILLQPNPQNGQAGGLLADYKQRLTTAQNHVKDLARNLNVNDPQALAIYGLAKQELNRIENETFSTEPPINGGPSENEQVAVAFSNMIKEVEKNCNETMTRFVHSLD